MAYREEEVIENGITYIVRYDENGKPYAKYIKPEDIEEPEPLPPEPTQLDRIEENTKYIMGNASALDVLLGVTENE